MGKTAQKFSSPELDAITKQVADHDQRLADAVAAAKRLQGRIDALNSEQTALRVQAAQATSEGHFEQAERVAHDIAVKGAAIDAALAAQGEFRASLAATVAEGEQIEQAARDAFEIAFRGIAKDMVESLQADLRTRLSAAWSAAIAGGTELAAPTWFQANLGHIVAGIRLSPADQIVSGAPRSWPRCTGLEGARQILEAQSVGDAA